MDTEPTTVPDWMPFPDGVVYLNSASSSPMPPQALQALVDYYSSMPVNYRSGSSPIEEQVNRRVEDVRAALARFLGTTVNSIVFTKNTTEAINIVAEGVQWESGDEIVVSPLEHQSNLVPWMRVAQECGVRLRYVQPGADGLVDVGALTSVLCERTRLVALHHVSNLLGCIQDIRPLSDRAHEFGALMLVDAAQSEGRVRTDVGALGCDFLVSCARKGLLGPQGIGFLWGRSELLRELRPLCVGSQSAEVVRGDEYSVLEVPYRHESGILNTAGVIALGASLEYINQLGIGAIAEYLRALTEYLLEHLWQLDGVECYGPRNVAQQAGIVSWSVRGYSSRDTVQELYHQQQVVAAGGSCGSPLALNFLGVDGVVRTSLHCFNTYDDVDTLIAGLMQVLRRLELM